MDDRLLHLDYNAAAAFTFGLVCHSAIDGIIVSHRSTSLIKRSSLLYYLSTGAVASIFITALARLGSLMTFSIDQSSSLNGCNFLVLMGIMFSQIARAMIFGYFITLLRDRGIKGLEIYLLYGILFARVGVGTALVFLNKGMLYGFSSLPPEGVFCSNIASPNLGVAVSVIDLVYDLTFLIRFIILISPKYIIGIIKDPLILKLAATITWHIVAIPPLMGIGNIASLYIPEALAMVLLARILLFDYLYANNNNQSSLEWMKSDINKISPNFSSRYPTLPYIERYNRSKPDNGNSYTFPKREETLEIPPVNQDDMRLYRQSRQTHHARHSTTTLRQRYFLPTMTTGINQHKTLPSDSLTIASFYNVGFDIASPNNHEGHRKMPTSPFSLSNYTMKNEFPRSNSVLPTHNRTKSSPTTPKDAEFLQVSPKFNPRRDRMSNESENSLKYTISLAQGFEDSESTLDDDIKLRQVPAKRIYIQDPPDLPMSTPYIRGLNTLSEANRNCIYLEDENRDQDSPTLESSEQQLHRESLSPNQTEIQIYIDRG